MESRRRRPGRWAAQANRAAHDAAQRVDDTSGQTTIRAASAIAAAVRLLRWPTAAIMWVPVPFIVTTIVIGVAAHGAVGGVIIVIGLVLAAVTTAFALRRRRVLWAVADPEALAAELRVMVNLTGRIEQTSTVLHDIAGGEGWRVLGRLRGLWSGASLPARWFDDVRGLPRAKYFAPPKIGTTISLAIAALWLVPISIVVTVIAAVGAIAGSI